MAITCVSIVAGCSATDAQKDFSGTWTLAADDSFQEAKLIFEDDGTFLAVGWPRNLECAEFGRASSPSRIDWVNTVEIHGIWEPGANNDVIFRTQDFACNGAPQLEYPPLFEWLQGKPATRFRLYLNGFNDEWNFVTFNRVS